MTVLKFNRTNRGFGCLELIDTHGLPCSIQQSSAIDNTVHGLNNPGSSFLWIGVDDPNPKIMAVNAKKHGINTEKK